ncbi:MAG: hypothetical protein IT210_00160 [Armatimonadetes bacterium]|nr:hypothetical protein [Armatimonadota bacterium]
MGTPGTEAFCNVDRARQVLGLTFQGDLYRFRPARQPVSLPLGKETTAMHSDSDGILRLRPYQRLCAVCALAGPEGVPGQALTAMRLGPDRPVRLVCRLRDAAFGRPGLSPLGWDAR